MLLTMNPPGSVVNPGFIAIRGDRIAIMGPEPAPADISADLVIDASNMVVLPGLINAHTHAAMTLFRGLADDLPLMEWLTRYIFPIERNLKPEWVYWGARLAALEMIRSGTTTFCDMYLFEDQTAEAAKSCGIRAMVGEVLYDFPSPSYGPLENGYEATRELALKWKDDPLISVAVEPHSPYTCAPELFEKAAELSLELDIPMITHLSESRDEINQVLAKHGKRPVAYLDGLGVLNERLIADHCVFLSEEEMDLLAARNVAVSHNPESNMKLASGIAPVPGLLKRGIRVGLGTDGCASNNNLNMFGEMDTAAKLHKVAGGDLTAMDAETVVETATLGGARALGMDGDLGGIENGKKADLIILDFDRPHLIPMYNPYSHLVYSANGSEVVTSIINGRPVMLNGRFSSIDEHEVFARVREIEKEIRALIGV